MNHEHYCDCTSDEAWQRLARKALGSPAVVKVALAFAARVIRETEDFGIANAAFRSLRSFTEGLDPHDSEQQSMRALALGIYQQWHAIIDTTERDDPRYVELRSQTGRALPYRSLEPLIPPASVGPVVRHEHYECYYRTLEDRVAEAYEAVFAREIGEAPALSSYLFGFDERLLSYTMGQSGKYGEDPRQIYERFKRGEVPPWKPFGEEHATLLAARAIGGGRPGRAAVPGRARSSGRGRRRSPG